MSITSFMENLLDGIEVEWRPLSNALVRTKGTKITAGQMKELHKDGAPVKIFAGGRTVAFVNYEDIPAQDINRKPSIIVKSRGIIEFEYYEEPFSHKNEMWSYHSNKDEISIKYIYHFLKLNESHFQNIGGKMQMPQIATPDTDKFLVPIPCPDNPKKSMEVQAEIVRILDAFSAMTAELTAELNLRKKQYNYYRDQLLSFEEGEVEWKTLPEVARDFGRGKSKHRPRNDARLYGGDIPFIQTGDIRNASHIITQYGQTYNELGLKQSKLWPKGTLCITIAANIAETAILGFDACFPDSVIGFVADPQQTSSDYVEYLLQSTKNQLEAKGREKSSAQSNINLATFEQLKLPFPTLEKQARIVAMLNKFDMLTNSITEGLPCEIELRQKQYEYYRDLLLSFPKPDSEVTA
ncbi:restriction endonuclease subunit S [Vibrio cholerae]|uniref:restriction endonuclease subunit S n=1 Tax=Vibrio cholerae TaxID=666 RepID=UPI0011D7957F|nr:restriction endonuclease subunit S [Vibrio cholerae]EGR2529609.1 restriction endonuclease subunit S [Vibrio cholerae]EKF9791670.1 restriction endonuclease subunit S [Vibrio cholerae]TYA79384.1 restriction endonuclease subunit S [Vibrio cholerae]GHY39801.1 type I restriction modification DNA specificity domain protein [Vibrio cholerae]